MSEHEDPISGLAVNQQQGGGQGGGQAGTGSGGGPGAATDAVAALGLALLKAAETKPASTADPLVSAAFALGWHMSELYEKHLPANERKPGDDLPGLGSLNDKRRLSILIDQVEVGVHRLSDPVTQAGLDAIDLTAVKALSQKEPNEDPVLALHEQLLGDLTAADFRLGKAYGLGRALADSCREPAGSDTVKHETLEHELQPFRIANLLRWLDDLASAFPPHAASSVAKSLTRWQAALYPRPETSTSPERRLWLKVRAGWGSARDGRGVTSSASKASASRAADATTEPLPAPAPEADVKETVRTLRGQGELWRALLSGEKAATDMLEIDNYLDATRQLVSQMAAIGRGVFRRMPLLVSVIFALVVVGVWLLFQGSSSQLVGGVTSILVALGLTWKGLGGALGQLVGKLEQPLWGAVLDDAIADAITLLPDNKADKAGRRDVAITAAKGSGQTRRSEAA